MTAVSFEAHLAARGHGPLRRAGPHTLQLNLGRRCNLACRHCHVGAGPKRTEAMDHRGVERVLELLRRSPSVQTLDVTGGAPELHPEFRFLVSEARRLGRRVIDRCNLTVFFEPGQTDTPAFLARHGVEIVASLPCYSIDNVDRQRGRGVFDASVEALRRLNGLGFGLPESPLRLDLVYNPAGPSLPPPEEELARSYRHALREQFGIEFHRLLTLTNMPIRRFARSLARAGHLEQYMQLLVDHFNPDTLPGLMCRSLVSVSWDGRLYDCDFNQAVALACGSGRRSIWDVDDLGSLVGAPIATGRHCFGCTAGKGSSCGGALT